MIGLALLAAHMLGDFVFSTQAQAETKLADWHARSRHVTTYCIPFIPIAVMCGRWSTDGRTVWNAGGVAFIFGLWVLHFLTDSHRFHSTFGDWVKWVAENFDDLCDRHILGDKKAQVKPLERNPWEPLPILIDQSLHFCQLAVLGMLFLR